ncbi:MAG: hypothetical protein U0871_24405 [Gemmataceae bacterium]
MRRWWGWDYLFAHYRWYRLRCGGHWELWWSDVTGSALWLRMGFCSNLDGYRPPGCSRRLLCEDCP